MEAIFQRLEMHMTFICPECGEMFELQQQWRKHLNFHHDYLCKTPEDFGFIEVSERYHECVECNQLVADGKRAIALLQYHRFIHLPYKCTYRCRHCSGTFMRKRICFNHLCRTHEHIIGKKLAAAALKTPMLSNKRDNRVSNVLPNFNCLAKENAEFYLRFICPQCGFELDTHDDWQKHIKESHRNTIVANNAMQPITEAGGGGGCGGSDNSCNESFMCKICDKILPTSDVEKHQRHYFMHLPHKLWFRCAYCRVRRPYKTEVLHHFMITHLIAFEKQRLHMRKPKEFGNDINKKLDRELDMLLKYGNNIGGCRSATSTQAATGNGSCSSSSSSSISAWPKQACVGSMQNTPDQNKIKKHIISKTQTPPAAMPKKILNTRYRPDAISKQTITNANKSNESNSANNNEQQRKGRSPSNIKKDLDALCAEIFKDIDDDESAEVPAASVNASAAAQIMQHENFFINNNNNNEEQIVSIEIDTLNEHEMNQITFEIEANVDVDEATATLAKRARLDIDDDAAAAAAAAAAATQPIDSKPSFASLALPHETFDNLKALYNAKVIHLCPQCGIPFAEQHTWRAHILEMHGHLINKLIEESFKYLADQKANLCLICNDVLWTTSATVLQRHRFTHMPYSAYLKCTLCAVENGNSRGNGIVNSYENSKPKMLEHLENKHSNYLFATQQSTNQSNDFLVSAIKMENLPSHGDNQKISESQAQVNGGVENSDCQNLFLHLKNARERLQRMALESGLEALN